MSNDLENFALSEKHESPSYVGGPTVAIRLYVGPDRDLDWLEELAEFHGWDADEVAQAIEEELDVLGYTYNVGREELVDTIEMMTDI